MKDDILINKNLLSSLINLTTNAIHTKVSFSEINTFLGQVKENIRECEEPIPDEVDEPATAKVSD